ncbi:hypothetical protein KW837_08690 [Pseudomonas sp. PDM24]|uniref:hypothetical protein n=1 Tax=Pseudomonas sp. PDM24 TaxID=2854777 RepID=UPI001C44A692|nr:hypothetical protein [Pseudomonas sp. PDM24]MBV7494337.1 hypothetical protein [Pseudomonas sp. PDM24]
MSKEGSFTGQIYIDGYALTCKLGFQYLDESSYQTGAHGVFRGGKSVSVAGLPKTEYLCANTCNDSKAVLFHFEHIGGGDYVITSREEDFYLGRYLGITDKSYVYAYESRSENNLFKLKKNGKQLTLSDMPNEVTSGLEMVCKDGGLELHKKAIYAPSNGNQWAAYLCSKDGDAGLVGSKLSLKIVGRNVE